MTAMPTTKDHPVTDRDGDDEASPKRRERRKILTSERAIAAVASALAAYLVTRTELAAKGGPSPEVVQTLQTTVNQLQSTVTQLEKTVDRLETKVDALTDSKNSFDAALNAFRLTNQNVEFRLSRVEGDLARLPNRNKQ